MDLMGMVMSSKGQELISGLMQSGFSAEQAKEFLPEAGKDILSALTKQDSTQLNLEDSASQTSNILADIDISALASKVGLSSGIVNSGLQMLIPQVLSVVKEKLGSGADLLSLLGGSNTDDMAAGLGKMVTGFFK